MTSNLVSILSVTLYLGVPPDLRDRSLITGRGATKRERVGGGQVKFNRYKERDGKCFSHAEEGARRF